MNRILRLFLLVTVLSISSLAQQKPASTDDKASGAFTLDQIMGYSFPSELTAAPKGNRIAWVFNTQGRRNIWVAACPAPCPDATKFTARQLTRYTADDGQEISDVSFSGDGATLVYVRGGNKNAAGDYPNPTSSPDGVEQAVWAVPVAAGAPRKLDTGNSPAVSPRGAWVAYVKENQIWIAPLVGTAKPKQIVVRGQNGSPVWSPDGRKLAFVTNRTSHSFIAVYDVGKKSVSYVAPSVDRDSAPRWSPDVKSIAFVRRPARRSDEPGGGFLTSADRPNPWAIWVAELATGQGRELWRSSNQIEGSYPNMAGDNVLNWAADDRIVFASEQDGWQHLYSIPAAGGTAALLTPGECEFEHATLTPDRRSIVYSSNCNDIDRRHLWRVSVSGGAPEAITLSDGIEWSPSVTGDAKWLAHLGSDARKPAMPYVRPFSLGSMGRMLAASVLPKDFPSAKLIVPQPVATTAPDGTNLHNQLFLPASCSAAAKCPALVYMHGGPIRQMLLGWHYMGYYHGDYAMNQYLASRGYIVLAVNYRSGIGYGRAFREAKNRGARGASEYQDVVAAGRYLASRPDVDPVQVGLWGGSYGGYLTAMGLARNSDIFAAGVDLHGVHDWSSGRFVQSGGLDPERRRVARESSPISSVGQWRSPVLLIHGDDDRNVNFAETVDLAARLREQGVTFEQLVYPDDVHDFLLFRHWREIFGHAADFFDRYLKNAGASRAASP